MFVRDYPEWIKWGVKTFPLWGVLFSGWGLATHKNGEGDVSTDIYLALYFWCGYGITSLFELLPPWCPFHNELHLELWTKINPFGINLFLSGSFITAIGFKEIQRGRNSNSIGEKIHYCQNVTLPDLTYRLKAISLKILNKCFCGYC